jgi:hypothetical protein
MQIEKQGGRSTPVTTMWPRIIGGQCEFCGVMDGNAAPTDQYKLCPHFQAIGEIECSYCDATVNPIDTMLKATIKVHQSPTNPEQLVVVCDKFTCTDKHIKRFQVNS